MEKRFLHSPLPAKGERVWRTYIGGKKLDGICGRDVCEDSHFPELWILSTVQANNPNREDIKEGICYVKVGEEKYSLADVISNYPSEMLGEEYSKKFSGNMGVLVKMIDAKERLTIQVHPTKENAKKYFGSEYGKTECWHIIDTRSDEVEEPCIHIGFKENVTRDVFVKCFEEQDLEKMLSLLHCVKVKKGETYIIPGGLPHAIGAGCTLVEIQEPTDYTLRVEKTTPAGYKIDDIACHQGIGFEKMFDCFSFDGKSLEDLINLCKIPEDRKNVNGNEFISLVGYPNTPCFKMEKIIVGSSITLRGDSSFYGIYVLSGNGRLISSNGEMPVQPNDQYFIPAICDDFTIETKGDEIELIRFWGQQI